MLQVPAAADGEFLVDVAVLEEESKRGWQSRRLTVCGRGGSRLCRGRLGGWGW